MRPGSGKAPVTVQIVSADARSRGLAVRLLNIVLRPGTPALGVSTPLCANQSSVRHCRASGLRGWTTLSPPRSSCGSRKPRVGTLARPALWSAHPRRFGADVPVGKTNLLYKCVSSRMAAGFGGLFPRDLGPGARIDALAQSLHFPSAGQSGDLRCGGARRAGRVVEAPKALPAQYDPSANPPGTAWSSGSRLGAAGHAFTSRNARCGGSSGALSTSVGIANGSQQLHHSPDAFRLVRIQVAPFPDVLREVV